VTSEIKHTFAATGNSPAFEMNGPFKIGVLIDAGDTASVGMDEWIGEEWVPVMNQDMTGALEFTSSGAGLWLEQPAGMAGQFRFTCGTFDTENIVVTAKGLGSLRTDLDA